MKPYIVIAHLADGVKVLDVPSKAEAHRIGRAYRAQGVDAFCHDVATAAQFKLDPRAAS